MKSSKLLSEFQGYTRTFESKFRIADNALTEAGSRELSIQNSILDHLREIAVIQLECSGLVSTEIKGVLAEREKTIAYIRKVLSNTEEEISAALDAQNACEAVIDGIELEIAEAKTGSSGYQSALQALEQALQAMEQARPNYDEISAEVAAKSPPYLDNKLFSYLANVQFGEPGYKGGRLARSLDRWVANQVNYLANKASLDALLALKTANQTQWDILEGAAADCHSLVEELNAQFESTFSIGDARNNLLQAEADVHALKSKAKSLHGQLKPFASNDDIFHRKAQDLMSADLQNKSLSDLILQCASTPTEDDDSHAAIVKSEHERLTQIRAQIEDLKSARADAREHYDRAKDLERKIRVSTYAGSKYRFSSGLDLGRLLAAYTAGTLDAGRIVREVEKHAQRIPEPTPAFSSGTGGGGFGSSGGFGGGGFGSSGGFGGGGFKTTGGF